MSDQMVSKIGNSEKGFHYTVTDDQIKEHQKLSILEIFEWLEETNKFIHKMQTPEERERMRNVKNIKL
jgi:hypothetical protein